MNNFYAQLFGLIALFTDAAIVNLLTKIINWLIRKITKIKNKYQNQYRRYIAKYIKYLNKYFKYAKKYLKLIFSKIRLIVVSFGIIFVLFQSVLMINDFRFKSMYPNKTTSLTYSSKPFSILICFPIVDQNNKIFKSRNFSKIELMSESTMKNKLNFTITFGYSKINFNYTVLKKVLFKNSFFNNQTYLSRCFRIEF